MLEIYFSIDNNSEILKIPYVYPEMDINTPSNNSTFETTEGKVLTILGAKGLRNFTLDSFFPSVLYSWMDSDAVLAAEAIDFIESNLLKVLKVVVISGNDRMLNMYCTLSDFNYSEKQNGDFKYSVKVTEYIDPSKVS
jgi:hypothetical protein